MIQLLTFPPAFGLFASSPFCVKVAYLLNMAGVAWEREDLADPRKMPNGKLPVLRVDGQLIADSDRIHAYLMAEGHDFDRGLSDLDRANARAFIRMVEEHLYFHLVYDRWGDDRIWPQVKAVYFATIPVALRTLLAGSVRRDVLKGLKQNGLARMKPEERTARATQDLEAIAMRLSTGPFLFGDRPTSADASVAPMLAATIATPGDTALKKIVSGNPLLTSYVQRVDQACG